MKRYLCTERDSYVYHGYYACEDVEPLIKQNETCIKALREAASFAKCKKCCPPYNFEKDCGNCPTPAVAALLALQAAGIPLEEPGEKAAHELATDGTVAPPDPALDAEQMAKISIRCDATQWNDGIDRIIEALAILCETSPGTYWEGPSRIRAQKRRKG